MAFNINNLPVGWSAGRVGQNRVFRTPDGRQIDPKEAAGILRNMGEEEGSTTASGSFSGFGSSDDDVIVNDPLSASSGMTIKRPTMDQPIVDDPDLNMRNGASDGAGQPDGVAPYVEEGIGDTGNAVAPSLSDLPSNDLSTEVPGFEDSAVIETKEDDVALEVTRPMGETGFTNSDGSQITNQSDIDGIQAILQADGSLTKEQAVRIYNYNQENVGPTGKTESLLPSIDADKVTNAGEEELSLSAGSTQGGGYSLPPTAGKMTTYKPDGTFTYNDIELFDYKTASDLLKGVSKGSPIGDVLAHYDSILSKGEPEIQGFDIEDTDPNSPTFGDIITADVVLGEDIVGTQGWGYYTTEAVEQQVIGADGVEKLNEDGTPLMETVHTEIFKIDANSLKAGMAYERSIDIFDNMQNFVQNSALATDASSRDLLVRQAMAFTEDQYALNRQSIAHFNALDAIAAQGGIAANDCLKKDSTKQNQISGVNSLQVSDSLLRHGRKNNEQALAAPKHLLRLNVKLSRHGRKHSEQARAVLKSFRLASVRLLKLSQSVFVCLRQIYGNLKFQKVARSRLTNVRLFRLSKLVVKKYLGQRNLTIRVQGKSLLLANVKLKNCSPVNRLISTVEQLVTSLNSVVKLPVTGKKMLKSLLLVSVCQIRSSLMLKVS